MHSILTLVPSRHHFTKLTVNVFFLLEPLAPLTSTSWHTTGFFFFFASIFLLVHSLTQFQSFLCLIYMSNLGFLSFWLQLGRTCSHSFLIDLGWYVRTYPQTFPTCISMHQTSNKSSSLSLKHALSQNLISPIHNQKPKNQPVKTTKKVVYVLSILGWKLCSHIPF